MSEEMIVPIVQYNKGFTSEARTAKHEYYITGDIGEPEEYVELCNILRNAGPNEEIILRINSRGGMVCSERMIVNSIQESQATVYAFIEYYCMSAATGIFLAADKHGWAEHIQFMVHCSWWGSGGKNPDIKSHTEFNIKQNEEEIFSTYSGLLDDIELAQCNDGKEFWFGAKELEARMLKYYEYKDEQGCGDPDCQECGITQDEIPEFNLEDIVAKAVEEGVTKALAARDAKEKKAQAKRSVKSEAS